MLTYQCECGRTNGMNISCRCGVEYGGPKCACGRATRGGRVDRCGACRGAKSKRQRGKIVAATVASAAKDGIVIESTPTTITGAIGAACAPFVRGVQRIIDWTRKPKRTAIVDVREYEDDKLIRQETLTVTIDGTDGK